MLLYCDGVSSMSDEQFELFFKLMPEARQKRAMRYVKKQDRQLCVAAFALLYYAMSIKGYKVGEYEMLTNAGGKPYFDRMPLEFSISHTSDVVACSVSQAETGVDVQGMVSEYRAVMSRVYSENEKNLVDNSAEPVDAFTKLWTLKESYVKCIGASVFDNADKYDFSTVIKADRANLYGCEFLTIGEEKYALSVCSVIPIKEIVKISLPELFAFVKKG